MQAPKMGWQELFEQLNGGAGRGRGAGQGGSGGSGGSGSGGSGSGSSGGSGSGSGGSGSGGSKGGGSIWSQTNAQLNERTRKLLKRLLRILVILLIPIIIVCYWWYHPPINIQSPDTWMFVGTFVLLPLFIFFYYRYKCYQIGTTKRPKSAAKAKLNKRLLLVPIAVVVAGLVGALMSSVIFPGNAERYSSILHTQELDFTSDIKQVNYEEIPVIDRASAVILGNRVMGGIPDYVSQFEISPLYSQINYKNHPVRVSPLLYADIIKWFTNSANGLPAYVKVDMTTQDTEIVRLEEPIRYSQSEVLDRNIYRHVQLSYPFYLLDEFSFEIDDNGHPWWIVPVQNRTIGLFGGTTISRVIMCDAVTGECTDLPIEEVPVWVDKAYPAELLIEQYNWYGAYHNGWLNSFLGQEGVVKTTPGTDGQLGYNYIAKDDDVWVYSGVTSAVADNSIVGFMLINQRTAEGHYYAIAGATEDSAMNSAQGQVQHLNYRATFPILLNVSNQPTYFMALKDAAGLVKMYAMLDIQRYQNVAVGDTLAQTEQAYRELLRTNGVTLPGEEGAAPSAAKESTGVVEAVATAVIDGNSHFFLTLEGGRELYDCALPGIMEALTVKSGSKVEITWREEGTLRIVEKLTVKSELAAPASALPASTPASDAA